MSNNRSAELITAKQQAEQNLSTDNTKSGGCTECGCTALIHYHYDDGRPVPDAPFTLTDSNKTVIEGATDKNGLVKITDMGCGTFDMLLEEGSDNFEPKETVANNTTFQQNPKYAVMAGEYFTLFSLLRAKGYLVYDASDSNDLFVDTDKGSWYQNVANEYEDAYDRFCELEKQINSGPIDMRIAVNKIHNSLAAEVAGKAGDNTAILLFCQIALGFVPVVGQALDLYDLGEWGWDTIVVDGAAGDPLHWAMGSLVLIGFIPGLGDAIGRTGKAVLKTVSSSNPRVIRKAVKTIRAISNGNVVKYLQSFATTIKEYGAKAIALLKQITAGLKKLMANTRSASWIVRLAKSAFQKLTAVMDTLSKKIESSIDWILGHVRRFIGKIANKFSGSSRPKASKNPKVDANAGANSGSKDRSAEQKKADGANTDAPAKEGQCTKGCPIDMATGNVVDWRTDFEVAAIIPLNQRRYYHSAGLLINGLLGSRWRSNWELSLTLDGEVATFTDEQYTQASYLIPAEGEYSRAAQLPQWRLYRSNGALLMRHMDGLSYSFNQALGNTLVLTKISDEHQNETHFLYQLGSLKKVLLSDGRRIHVDSQFGRIDKLELFDSNNKPLQTLAEYQYDHNGFMLSCRAGPGNSFDYQYSPEGYLLRWADLSKTWVEHDYDAKGRAITSRGAEKRFCDQIRYDDDQGIVFYKSPQQGVSRYYHDERNNIIKVCLPNGDQTLSEYADNQLVAETNGLGERQEFSYNDWGQMVAQVQADGSTSSYAYDDLARLVKFTNPMGHSWQLSYNAEGRLASLENPLQQQWHYQYNGQGLLSCEQTPAGEKSHYRYNALGLPTECQLPGLETLRFNYDAQGRLLSRSRGERGGQGERALRQQQWQYQGASPLVATTVYEDGSRAQFQYDSEGNLIEFSDALGHVHRYQYGAFDKLSRSTDPLGNSVQYQYDGECQFAGLSNSQQQNWYYQFNRSGQIIAEHHFDGRQTKFAYDPAGQVIQKIQADGSSQHFRYDALGRMVAKQNRNPEGQDTRLSQFEYNAASQLLAARNSDALVEYQYDALGRVVSESINGQSIHSEYDASGQRCVIELINKLPGASQNIHQQWQQGLLQQLQIGQFAALQFNHNNQGLELQRHNKLGFDFNQRYSREGLLQEQSLQPSQRFAEQAGSQELIGQHSTRPARFQHLQRSYHYDALDRIQKVDDSHWGANQYQLDGNGQITQESQQAPFSHSPQQIKQFDYDSEQNLQSVSHLLGTDNGNVIDLAQKRIAKQLKYQQAGRVEQVGKHRYHYDANGRLIQKISQHDGFRPQAHYYSWDEDDQLIRAKLPNGDSWSYRYDPFGRRIAKIKHQPKQQELCQSHYRWDGDNLIEQQQCYADGTPAHSTQWVYQPNSFRPLAQLKQSYTVSETKTENEEAQQHIEAGSASLHYIVTDQAGTPRELCTEQGDIHWRGQQDIWGEHHSWRLGGQHKKYQEDAAANDPVNCELRYQGQILDQETGLYYNRHRYYDPESNQYLSPDPIGFAGGLRPQGYVHNPVEWVDPLGLSGCPKKNKKTTYEGEGRRDSFREAKRDAGVPVGQQPVDVKKVDMTDRNGNAMLDSDNNKISTREYHYRNTDGERLVIQDHSAGHSQFSGSDAEKSHFNVRKYDADTGDAMRTKSFPGTHGHYTY